MRFFLIFLLFFALGSDASAQFTDSVHHLVSFASTGSINRTNDGTNYLMNNGLKFGLRRQDIALNANNTWIYGANSGRLTNNDFTSTLDFNLYKTFKHFFYWGLGNYTTSYSLRIDNQVQGGLGVAYNLLDKQHAVINLSDGFLYERSNIFVNDTVKNEYHTFRNSLRLQFRWKYKGFLTVNGSGFFQPSLSYSDDYIVKTNVNLSLKVFRYISFTTALNYNLVTRTDRETLLFTYGLTIDRYF